MIVLMIILLATMIIILISIISSWPSLAEMEKRVDTGDISVLIFFSCANFLAAYPQTNYKHCAVLDCAKSN